MTIVVRAAEYIIFFSYCIIASIVAYIFVRHRSHIDSWINRLLMLTIGLFLMLCACTHLYSVWFAEKSVFLQSACALVSFISAACAVLTFRGLDDYLRLRVTTADMMRQEIVTNLTQGYDLKVRVMGNTILSGVAGEHVISEPNAVGEGFDVNDIIRIHDRYFRIANIIRPFVSVRSQSLAESGLCGSEHGAVSLVYGYDATAEVHMRDESDRLNQVKMEMCRMTAHHVKTPLSCIGIALEGLRSPVNGCEHVDLLDEAMVHYELINMIMTQFVDAAAMDLQSEMKPSVDYANIRDIVCRVEKVLRRLRMDGVRSACFVEDGVPDVLITDSDWLLQILLNLVANAARHTFRGLITLNVSLCDVATLSIIVKDTGVSLVRQTKDFTKREFVTDTFCDYGSTDVGMYSVDNKIRAMGGDYDITESFDGGTVFSATVPVEVNEACYAKASENIHHDSVKVVRVKRVLVVDDTAFVRRLMQRHMGDHSVDVAVNGIEALAKMQRGKYDIVFLDLMMPVLDGLGCLRRFREWETEYRDPKERQLVYCMSATCVDLDSGFDGSIPKPVDVKRLREIVEGNLR